MKRLLIPLAIVITLTGCLNCESPTEPKHRTEFGDNTGRPTPTPTPGVQVTPIGPRPTPTPTPHP